MGTDKEDGDTYDDVLGLVACLCKVEVVCHVMILVGVKGDLHVEFTPSFF